MKAGNPVIYYPANVTEEVAVPVGALVVKPGETEVKLKSASGIESVATSSTVSSAVAAVAVKDWQASIAVVLDEVRRATLTAGTIESGDLIRSNSARTTGATFDATEAGNWTEFTPDIVTSVAGRTGAVTLAKADVGLGSADNTADTAKPVSTAQQTALDGKSATAHTHAESEVTNLTTDLAGKQATLVSGTNIKTVNGVSVLGAGNVSVAADLPGGSATTVTDEGIDAGNSVVDRATVAGQTILKYQITSGTSIFKVPLNVTSIWALGIGGGGSGGGGVGGGGGSGRFVENNAITVVPGASYTITIGTGGASVNDGVTGNSGTASSIGSLLIASGGGGGGSNNVAGVSGASGGGGGCNGFPGGAATAGTATGGASPDTTGFGFAGGAGANNGSSVYEGGGGGGAGAIGSDASPGTSAGGNGGTGRASTITGTSTGYAGGGGGGTTGGQRGTATDGGGGNGGNGTANTGGGGGASGNSIASGIGGSGTIIIRFATQTRSYQALTSYADNAAAIAGGKLVGQFYRKTSDGSVQQVQ